MRNILVIILLSLQISCAQELDQVEIALQNCLERDLNEKDQDFKERLSEFEQQMINQGVLESADGNGFYKFFKGIANSNKIPDYFVSEKFESFFDPNSTDFFPQACLQGVRMLNKSDIEKSNISKLVNAYDELNATRNLSPSKIATVMTSNLSQKDFDKQLYRYLSLYVIYSVGLHDEGIIRSLPPPEVDEDEINYEELHIWFLVGDELMVNEQAISEKELKTELRKFILKQPRNNRTVMHTHRKTTYEFYLKVQNLIQTVYREIREEKSMERFSKSFEQLSESERNQMIEEFPMNIQEAESYK